MKILGRFPYWRCAMCNKSYWFVLPEITHMHYKVMNH